MELSSNSSQPANHLVQKAIDETVIIKEAEIIRTEPEENFTVKYNHLTLCILVTIIFKYI